jgi:hypothetical protein
MNSRHVYIGNHYSFSTPSSKYRASAVGGFFDVFYEIFPKYREGNQYRITATSALTLDYYFVQPACYCSLNFRIN